MNKNIKLITISAVVLALIGLEFYLLLSTKMQVGDIKTKVTEIENKIKQKESSNQKDKHSKERVEDSQNLKEQISESKGENTNKQTTSVYTSQKLESPDGDKAFYFVSENSDIKNKKIDYKTEWDNYYFSFNGDTRFRINSGKDKNGGNLQSKVEFSNGDIRDITEQLGRFSCALGGVKVLGWHDNSSLLLGCRSGDAGHLWMDMWVVNINDSDSDNLISCRHNSGFGSRDSSSVSHCVHDNFVYIQECNSVDNSSFETDCKKASTYQTEQEIEVDNLGDIMKRKDWIKKVKKEASKVDQVGTDFDFNSFDEVDEFNIKNAGDKFKIKDSKENENSLIWNLDTGELIK